MDALELQNRLKNFTHRMVSLCESIPLTDRCRVFEHQLLSFAYAIDMPVQPFTRYVKPLEVSLSIASEETRQTLWLLDVVAHQKMFSLSRLSELQQQGTMLVAMLNAPVIKKQQSNRNN